VLQVEAGLHAGSFRGGIGRVSHPGDGPAGRDGPAVAGRAGRGGPDPVEDGHVADAADVGPAGSPQSGDAAAEVRALLAPVADPARAPVMAAYMKGVAPFLGVTTPARREATGDWIRGFEPGPDARDLLGAAHAMVRAPEREFAYVAVDLVRRHERALPPDALLALRALALERPWWDTVDAWATCIGRTGLRHRGWDAEVGAWARDPRLWVRRIALVFQVGRRDAVDLAILFAACEANLTDTDFFMRKGIGWGLRDAARRHPAEVLAFVEAHREGLSALSLREATKHLAPAGTST
jgi:3-methyladenine DNA glycosylase AlkD